MDSNFYLPCIQGFPSFLSSIYLEETKQFQDLRDERKNYITGGDPVLQPANVCGGKTHSSRAKYRTPVGWRGNVLRVSHLHAVYYDVICMSEMKTTRRRGAVVCAAPRDEMDYTLKLTGGCSCTVDEATANEAKNHPPKALNADRISCIFSR